MLVLSRKLGQRVLVGDNVKVVVLDIKRGVVKLGVEAPKGVTILREELAEKKEPGK